MFSSGGKSGNSLSKSPRTALERGKSQGRAVKRSPFLKAQSVACCDRSEYTTDYPQSSQITNSVVKFVSTSAAAATAAAAAGARLKFFC